VHGLGKWTVLANIGVGVGRRLPAALIGAVMVVTFTGMLGPTWGPVIAVSWMVAGLAVLTRSGERLFATRVLRYRPAVSSWLAADVHRLAPGRRVDVYLAPPAGAVFAVGGHGLAIGDQCLDPVGRAPSHREAMRAAMGDLCTGRTSPELALMWWSAPWVFAKMTVGAFLPAHCRTFFQIVGGVLLGMAVLTCLRHGQTIAAAIGTCMLADLALAFASRRRILAAKRSTSLRQGRIPSDPDAPAGWRQPQGGLSSPAGPGNVCKGAVISRPPPSRHRLSSGTSGCRCHPRLGRRESAGPHRGCE